MNKKALACLAFAALILTSCGESSTSTTSGGGQTTGSDKTSSPTTSSIDVEPSEAIKKYMNNLKETSKSNHLYVHYYGLTRDVNYYNKYDVWAWPLSPKQGEGYRFDWNGRTTSADRLSASGDAVLDSLGYSTCDIDLMGDYDGGWDAASKKMGGTPMNFRQANSDKLDEKVGIQLVESQTRITGSGFWECEGGNLPVELANFALENTDKSTSYHIFLVKENVQKPTSIPLAADQIVDPFENDDGQNYTYGKSTYNNADWNDKALQPTSNEFLKGGNVLQNGAGVGYQIMVASFADSDGDGFGDIYGIEQKLDYIQGLGVNVLWLTPIQLSDSYHGYDIADYTKVDPKFGSKVSPAAKAAGKVDSTTAMQDYISLLNEAHKRNMAVVMDLVLNHTSTTNEWFINSAQLAEQFRGYYQWGNNKTDSSHINQEKFWYPYGDHVYSYYAKFGSQMPELNYAYVGTRQAVETMAKNWCEIGVDGFRMDAVKHIFLEDETNVASGDTIVKDVSASGDYSSDLTKNVNFWRELNYEVKKAYPNAFFVGENFDGHAYHGAPFYEGFDSLFDFYSYFNLTSVASHEVHGYTNGDKSAGFWGNLGSFLGINGEYGNSNWEDATEAYNPNKELQSGDLAGSVKSFKYNDKWTLRGVMNAYNQYRTGGNKANKTDGYSMINGAFTSNHDIARAINRIAGDSWQNTGLTAQGEVTNESYEVLDTMATLTEITELMLPGCTWIYYGDELGMTGNLGDKAAGDSYSDLTYRQPMKWKQDGKSGDGSFTTGYGVTGSAMNIKWDNINGSTKVASAEDQVKNSSSHYNALANFAKIKSASPTLIRGYYQVKAIEAGSATGKAACAIQRVLGNDTYTYIVNFGNTPLTDNTLPVKNIAARSAYLVDNSGKVVAQYNGKTGTISGNGGAVTATKYSVKVGSNSYYCTKNEHPLDSSFEEWMALGVEAKVGDVLSVYDNENKQEFTPKTLDSASKGFSLQGGKIVCTTAGKYDVYLKLQFNNDQIYIGYAE